MVVQKKNRQPNSALYSRHDRWWIECGAPIWKSMSVKLFLETATVVVSRPTSWILTRKPTNWWGSANRDDTHPRTTVVYSGCYHLFRKRLCTPKCIWALSYVRLERDNNTKIAICVMLGRWQVHLSHISGAKEQKCLMAYTTRNHPFQNIKRFLKSNHLHRYHERTRLRVWRFWL